MNRVAEKGTPIDMTFSRFAFNIMSLFRNYVAELQKMKLNQRFDHRKFSLEPDHSLFGAHPTINDDLPNKIIAGSVKIKANVEAFTETTVKFEDGTEELDIDAVILSTGYIFGFPFLDKTVTYVSDNKVNLYKYMFPPHLSKHTLAIIGCFQPLGAIMPLCEQQCRLATRVFLVSLYSRLSLSRIPRDSIKYCEISVPRHIRVAELRKNYSNNHI